MQISVAVTAKLISAFVFDTRIIQSLYFPNPKFKASSHLLWLYSPVCVGPGHKLRRPIFSQRGSNYMGVLAWCQKNFLLLHNFNLFYCRVYQMRCLPISATCYQQYSACQTQSTWQSHLQKRLLEQQYTGIQQCHEPHQDKTN